MSRKKEKKPKIKVYETFTVSVEADIYEEVADRDHIKSGNVTIDMKNMHDNIKERMQYDEIFEFRKQKDEIHKIIEYLSKNIKVEKCNYEIEHRYDPIHFRGSMNIVFTMGDRKYDLTGYIYDCDTEVINLRPLNINTYQIIPFNDCPALKKELVTYHNLDCPKVFQYFFQKLAECMDEKIDYALY